MHPLDFAMQLELDGKEFYLEKAKLMEDSGLREVFEGLAADEEKHYQLLKQIKESGLYDYTESTIAAKVESIFTDPKDQLPHEKYVSYVAVYEQAIEFEEKARDMYEELANQAQSEREREVYQMMEREEETHRTILWRILQFLTRPEEQLPYI